MLFFIYDSSDTLCVSEESYQLNVIKKLEKKKIVEYNKKKNLMLKIENKLVLFVCSICIKNVIEIMIVVKS